jgi:LmbE family N-acetylglucosaminyl deacetylase
MLEDDLYEYQVECVTAGDYAIKGALERWSRQGYRVKEMVPSASGHAVNIVFEKGFPDTGPLVELHQLILALRRLVDEVESAKVKDSLVGIVASLEH